MYNPEEDIIPEEVLRQALMLSNQSFLYKVYFDINNGDLISVTNEEIPSLTNYVEMEYDTVSDFLKSKKSIEQYKLLFVDQATPIIVNKNDNDVDLITLQKVEKVDHWNSIFTIENYPLMQKWGFQLRPDQRKAMRIHNLNTVFEIYVIGYDNLNFLIRTIKISLKDLIDNDKFFVNYVSGHEKSVYNNIFIRKFFDSTGFQILYDTNS
jgi:hypothetical protein